MNCDFGFSSQDINYDLGFSSQDTNCDLGISSQNTNCISKKCNKCHENKPLTEFHIQKNCLDGHMGQCKICRCDYQRKQTAIKMREPKNFVVEMVRLCRKHDKVKGLECDLTEEFIFDVYKNQHGLCAVTSLPIYLKQGAFQASPERRDNTIGHTEVNTCLVALECNNHNQWTKERVIEMLAMADEPVDIDVNVAMLRTISTAGKPVYKWRVVEKNGESFVFCHNCQTEKTRDQFNKTLKRGCKNCCNSMNKQRRSTWRGAFLNLFGSSKGATKFRNRKGRDHEHDITLEYLIQLYIDQDGRCYYSKVPLQLEGHFKVSLERLDVTKGYIEGNVVLVLAMLNSIDRLGLTGWSREKFHQMKDAFLANEDKKIAG
jgi:hypothetical protein